MTGNVNRDFSVWHQLLGDFIIFDVICIFEKFHLNIYYPNEMCFNLYISHCVLNVLGTSCIIFVLSCSQSIVIIGFYRCVLNAIESKGDNAERFF